MSHRGQESQPGYMDDVCVKISEKYKPPPRINLAVTYSQRLSLNNQIRDNMIPYDFSLETNVKGRVKDLRNVRKLVHEEKKDRLEKIKRARQKYEEVKAVTESETVNTSDKKETEIFNVSSESNEAETKHLGATQVSQILNVPTANAGVLYPTPYSHILTPTPLTNVSVSQTFTCKPNDKSPFNISDFEADTSSPFDNMELKTINDIEELAQVLKKDDFINTLYSTPYTASQAYSNYVPLPSISTHSNIHSNYAAQETLTTNQQYATYTIPHHSMASVPSYGPMPATSMYNNVNGSYYTPEVLQLNQSFRPYTYNNVKSDNSSDIAPPQTKVDENKKTTTFKSVPDIMKALEAELDNTHIYKTNYTPVIENHRHDITRPKKTEDGGSEQIPKSVELEDPYERLPSNLQHLSKNISSMGFPLPRVARACQVLGDDHKKIVEHLLVMSELLDLGFLEKDVSTALLQCNNDRDKALDILIS